MTPPSEDKLRMIRGAVEGSPIKASQSQTDATETPVATPAEKPPIHLGNLELPPTLQEYSEVTPRTGAHLSEMATQLEAKGQTARALLAWERVLDLARSDATQIHTAIAAIQRLRPKVPDWNTDPAAAILITLHASTATKNVESLKPVLAQAALEMEKASAGILKVSSQVSPGRNPSALVSNPPVALWISGPDEKSTATDVLSFTADSPSVLQAKTLKNSFELIRNFLGRANSANPAPPGVAVDGDPVKALHSHVTRLTWQNFGRLLNHPAGGGI